MGRAKKAGIGFLSFLLFLSLGSLSAVFMMDRTVLNPDFIIAEIDKLDVAILVGEMVKEQVPPEAGLMKEAVDDAISDLRPWVKQQTGVVIQVGYDYVLGKSQHLTTVINLEPAKEVLKAHMRQAFLASLPSEFQGVPQAELESHFDEFYQGMSAEIPSTFEINEDTINGMDPEIMPRLEQARHYLGYLTMVRRILIAVTIALIVGISLLHRRVKGATRSIGIPCLICGILSYAGTLISKHLVGERLAQVSLPSQLQAWLPQVINDFLAPAQTCGIVFIAVGVALLIISVVYKRGEPSIYQG